MILGIDTSAYTTSAALVDLNGRVIASIQNILNVKKGTRGLRQSEALFKHVNAIPEIIENIARDTDMDLKAVCSSTKPRCSEGSYMPVFIISDTIGRVMAAAKKIPYYSISHQENHIKAAEYSLDIPIDNDEFYAIHLSGGTTEFLSVKRNITGYDIDIIGSTQDLHAGQFVDRIGVAMGLQFPCGAELENIASKGSKGYAGLPSFARDNVIGFSGAETRALKLIENGERHEDVAFSLFKSIGRTLEKWILNVIERENADIIIAGGVASNSIIKNYLKASRKLNKYNIRFAKPEFARDNAVGCALLGLDNFLASEGELYE